MAIEDGKFLTDLMCAGLNVNNISDAEKVYERIIAIWGLQGNTNAIKHLKHYRHGNGFDYHEIEFQKCLDKNPKIGKKITRLVKEQLVQNPNLKSGRLQTHDPKIDRTAEADNFDCTISQGDYDIEDWHFANGNIDIIDWRLIPGNKYLGESSFIKRGNNRDTLDFISNSLGLKPINNIEISFRDIYFWSPQKPRPTQRIHIAMELLKKATSSPFLGIGGAQEYVTIGKGIIYLENVI